MARRPRVLDLFSCAGGAAMGYHVAGFQVAGIDLEPQPNYPFQFSRADALTLTERQLRRFDLIHASPPCQAAAAITKGTNRRLAARYLDLFPQTLELLESSGRPYVIENPAARPDVVLCGEMFGLAVIRHRRFQLGGWSATQPPHVAHRGRVAGYRHGEWFDGPYFAVYGEGGGKGSVSQWQSAMGIHWTSVRREIAEALPPAYTQFLGGEFLAQWAPPKRVRRVPAQIDGQGGLWD